MMIDQMDFCLKLDKYLLGIKYPGTFKVSVTIIRLVCYKGSPTTLSGVSHFSLPFICPLLWQSRVQCSLYFPSAQSGSVLHCPKAECDMQKRAKKAKCGRFSGQFSRCCRWGQKRPRPVCVLWRWPTHSQASAEAFTE